MEKKIMNEVEALSDELVELCRELVRTNTVNPYSGDPNFGSEAAGQRILKPVLENMGARVRLFEPPEGVYSKMGVLGPKERDFKGRPNLVAEFDFGRPGKRIIINGHMDTVAASGMSIDPFSAEVKDGLIWGRGTSDCKGGLSSGLIAVKALLPFADELSGSIVYESVVDEECNGSGAGTLACCYEGYRGDAAIVVDGNDLEITTGCGGCLTADLKVFGRMGHAARSDGVSAIEKALIIKRGIDAFKKERERLRPSAKVNLGVFRSGVHPAVVPGEAYMSLNIVYELDEAEKARRDGRGWGGKQIMENFQKAIREAERADSWFEMHPAEIEWVKDLIPFQTPEDGELVRELTRACKDVLSTTPTVRSIPAWADAAYLYHFAETPTVLFGPGIGKLCHAPDENVTIENLVNSAKVIALYLYRQLSGG